LLVNTTAALNGIADVIEKEITPDLNSKYPKAQSYAIISMLRSLSTWEENRDKILSKENKDLRRLLKEAKPLLVSAIQSSKSKSLRKRIKEALNQQKKEFCQSEKENLLLRELLDDLLLSIDSEMGWSYSSRFRDLRKDIQKSLKKRIKLEMRTSAPLRMAEFSKGSK
jgi:hypothetical protein